MVHAMEASLTDGVVQQNCASILHMMTLTE